MAEVLRKPDVNFILENSYNLQVMSMAGHLKRLNGLFTQLSNATRQKYNTTCFLPAHRKSAIGGPSIDDPYCQVEIGVTSDGQTIVCYHPSMDVPYELTQAIPRPDPLINLAENHDQVLKAHLSREVLQNKKAPTIEELSKMFYTTKHRWYPVGQYHIRRRKGDPPKDR